jgi:beta-1,4-mannosyltransferase
MIFELTVVLFCLLAFIGRFRRCPVDSKPLVQVVVLGDIGHSPRMQYHALSLAETGKVCVELIGFRGSKALAALSSHSDIKLRYLRQTHIPPSWKVPFVVYAAIKILFECFQLFFVLVTSKYRADVILVQIPPAVPSLFVCGLVSLCSGCKLVVDFHNITYMHLAAKVKNPLIISLVRFYEQWTSRLFTHHAFCVTKSMQKFLRSEFNLDSVATLYDRPGPQFKGRTSAIAIEDLEARLIATGVMKSKISAYDFILASSTSWTKDEDFGLVLSALPSYSKSTDGKRTLLFITGKGEMRDSFISDFNKLNLPKVDLVTAWLPAADYPLLLGSATVGISVHTSTSGLDLPMKAVDMLGCELPVVALKFPALVEMLGDGEGGIGFTTADELSTALLSLTIDDNAKDLREKLSKFGKKFRTSSDWRSEWTQTAWPVFEKYIPRRSRQSRRRL